MASGTRGRVAQRGGREPAEAGSSSATGANRTPLGERTTQLQTGDQLQTFAERIATLEARLAATAQANAGGQQQNMMQALVDGQRQANEVMARLVSRTWKPPTHVVEFSEDQDWASYRQYLLPLCGHLEPRGEVNC